MAKHKGQGQRAQDQQGQQTGQAEQIGQSQQSQSTEQATQAENAPTSPLETQQFGGSLEAPIVEEATTPPAPEPNPGLVEQAADMTLKHDAKLADLLASLTPEQLAKIRLKAIGEGVVPAASLGGTKSADGSLTLSVTLDPMVTEQLELWAEADGCTLVEEAQKRITESLQNYLYGDWSVNEQIAAPASTNASAAK